MSKDIHARRKRVREMVLALLQSEFWMTKYFDTESVVAVAAILDHNIETMQFQGPAETEQKIGDENVN